MEALRQYVLSVVVAALICGILSGLVQNGPAKDTVRLLCGLFLTITVLKPLTGWDTDHLMDISQTISLETSAVVTEGERLASKAVGDIIKEETEAYILDKASELNVELTVSAILNRENIPVAAEIEGDVSPFARRRLTQVMETDLGITKENQQWTG